MIASRHVVVFLFLARLFFVFSLLLYRTAHLFPTRRIVYILSTTFFFYPTGTDAVCIQRFLCFRRPRGVESIWRLYSNIPTHNNSEQKRKKLYTTELEKDSEHDIFQLSYSIVAVYGCIVHPTVIFSIMEWMAAGLEHVRPTVWGLLN